jgi:hypothetical protein
MSISVESMVGKMLEPAFRSLPRDVAQCVADYQGDEQLEQHIESLARKANAGELSPDEHEEYAAYIRAGNILATMQAVARRTLNEKTG